MSGTCLKRNSSKSPMYIPMSEYNNNQSVCLANGGVWQPPWQPPPPPTPEEIVAAQAIQADIKQRERRNLILAIVLPIVFCLIFIIVTVIIVLKSR